MYKRYKDIDDNRKVACLVTEAILDEISQNLDKMKMKSNGPEAYAKYDLFHPVLSKIYVVLEYNYLSNFSNQLA